MYFIKSAMQFLGHMKSKIQKNSLKDLIHKILLTKQGSDIYFVFILGIPTQTSMAFKIDSYVSLLYFLEINLYLLNRLNYKLSSGEVILSHLDGRHDET
jgi:hypothetical protein